jgi:hypothetical protein
MNPISAMPGPLRGHRPKHERAIICAKLDLRRKWLRSHETDGAMRRSWS